jgi:exosome complex component RRP45
MTTSSTYVAVRDDKTFRSLSLNERDFLRDGAHSSTILRLDGRRGDEIRKVRLKLGRWDNGAECTVQWGVGTRITSLCTAELVPPSPDRPNEGIINFTVDLSPMAGTSFRQAPPVGTAPSGATNFAMKGPNFSDKNQRLLSNRILRSVERIVLLGGALDSEALVLIPGSWVWRFTIALTVLDDGGNVTDACVLAAIATLRHYRKPQVDVDNDVLPTLIPSTVKEPSPLPLHHTPLSISFALLPSKDNSTESSVATLVDPEKREELVQFGTLSIAMNTHMVSRFVRVPLFLDLPWDFQILILNCFVIGGLSPRLWGWSRALARATQGMFDDSFGGCEALMPGT